MNARLLLIDNYDSFTYNLVQAFLVLGADVAVHRNDAIGVDEALATEPTHLCVSPGPGRPDDAGVSLEMVAAFAGRIPVLGVCLGHQCVVQHSGGEIVSAAALMHGKTSWVQHSRKGLFESLPNPLEAGRYHSLAASRTLVPEALIVTATTEDGEIMAVQHRELNVFGVQFHPESVLTPDGPALLRNFLKQAAARRSADAG